MPRPAKPKISARNSSVKLIGMPTKIANSITTSMTMPSHSRPLIGGAGELFPLFSYLEFFPMLELAAEADLEAALQHLGRALHHQQHGGERDRGAERPHDGAPRRLFR